MVLQVWSFLILVWIGWMHASGYKKNYIKNPPLLLGKFGDFCLVDTKSKEFDFEYNNF